MNRNMTRIVNALICDGSGREPFEGSVAFEGGAVTAVDGGRVSAPNPSDIDAAGRVVCPAFVDIHRHPDVMPFTAGWRGEAELRQGIGYVVCGNCGISLTPAHEKYRSAQYAFDEPVLGPVPAGVPTAFPEYLNALEKKALPFNMAAMIGTGSVRVSLKGFSDAPFTRGDLDEARAMIDEALACGAPGVSLGIMYLPECHTSAAEYAHMLRPVGQRGKIITTHMRGEGDSLLKSVSEVIDIADQAGCALEISHFKACGVRNWRDMIFRAIDLIEAARAKGQDVSCDFYPYDGGSTALTTMLPPAFIGGDLEGALQRLGTREGVETFRKSAALEYPDWDNFALTLGWERIVISGVTAPENRRFVGLTVTEGAEKYGFDDACALAAHLMHTDRGKTAIINMSMCQSDIDAIARLSWSAIISDAIYAATDTPHPRLYGAMPRAISDLAVRRHVLPLHTAIHKMTGLPARRMGLKAGLLAPGQPADLLMFDPARFHDTATYKDPARLAEGLHMMWLSGEPVVRDDRVLTARAGRLVRVP